MEGGQVLKALGDDRAIGRASAVALGLGLVEWADAQVVDQAHVGGLDVLEHLLATGRKAHDSVGAQQLAADLDGNIALAHVHAVDGNTLLACGEHAVQTVVD